MSKNDAPRLGTIIAFPLQSTHSMKPKIQLSLDKTKVTEGDIVEFTWSSTPAEKVELTLDNGYKANTIPVEAQGTKKFRLNRSKGRTYLVIGATVDGKTYYESVKVKVKKIRAQKAEYMNDYTGARGARENGLYNTWKNFKTKFKISWDNMPDRKRLAFKVLGIWLVVMIVAGIWPKFLLYGQFIVIGYLLWVLWKR